MIRLILLSPRNYFLTEYDVVQLRLQHLFLKRIRARRCHIDHHQRFFHTVHDIIAMCAWTEVCNRIRIDHRHCHRPSNNPESVSSPARILYSLLLSLQLQPQVRKLYTYPTVYLLSFLFFLWRGEEIQDAGNFPCELQLQKNGEFDDKITHSPSW
ncbi:hypothetical protein B0H34DRAFT_701013 [Crassisporium funariophilum]|nr:hypothetical protein B0H34DRAFT_701013 [Crassisporium funariophilum]